MSKQLAICPTCGLLLPAGHKVPAGRRPARADHQGERPKPAPARQVALKEEAPPQAPFTPRSTDHGLLRFLERRWGVPVEDARKEMMSVAVCEALAAGVTSITISGDATRPTVLLRAAEGRVVTVLLKDRRLRPKPMRQPKERPPGADEIKRELADYFEDLAERIVT